MSRNSEQAALIYYALDATHDGLRLKIGSSAQLSSRVSSIATVSGQRPIIVALELGSFSLEFERHRQFATSRIMGEWFTFDDHMRDHVRTLGDPFEWLVQRPGVWPLADGWRGVPRIEHNDVILARPHQAPVDF